MAKVIVIGSANTDMVVKANRFPHPGETIIGGEFFMNPGGKGANQAVAARRAGGEVVLVCKVGNDIFGTQVVEGFRKEGIITDYVSMDLQHPSGVALILVDGEGENEIVVAPGSNANLAPTDIKRAEDAIVKSAVALLQLEIPMESVLFAAGLCAEKGCKVILNPAPALNLPHEIFPLLFLITPNETEAEILTGVPVTNIDSAARAAQGLLDKGVQNVIITMGSSGAFFMNASKRLMVPSPEVKALDTTAAGDVFNGVLAVQLADNHNWETAISIACKAAAISVTRLGAQSSAPFLHELT
jgi:ribokinase